MRGSELCLVLTATFSRALARFLKEDNPFVFQEKFSADYRSECPSPGQRPWPSLWLCSDYSDAWKAWCWELGFFQTDLAIGRSGILT